MSPADGAAGSLAVPLVLAALAVVLAGPLPALLAGRHWLRRTPRAALLLVQGGALAAVLAALGAGLAVASAHVWQRDVDLGGGIVAGAALLLTAVVAGRLVWSGHRVGTRLRALRRRHRAQVDVLARAERLGPGTGRVHVLDHELPMAYCLPGVQHGRVVVSAGTLEQLGPDEVRGVVAHERAHLRARHDLVLEGFSVLHEAFPRWVSSRQALAEARLLVEVLADRRAARAVGPRPVARALVALAGSRAPSAALGVAGVAGAAGAVDAGAASPLLERVRLLGEEGSHRVQATLVVLAALAVVAVPTAFVATTWLAAL